MQDRDTRYVYLLSDLTNAQLIWLKVAYTEAGKVNSAYNLCLVIDSVRPDTKHAGRPTVPALADGAGGSPIG